MAHIHGIYFKQRDVLDSIEFTIALTRFELFEQRRNEKKNRFLNRKENESTAKLISTETFDVKTE